jgi:hypothetical protein
MIYYLQGTRGSGGPEGRVSLFIRLGAPQASPRALKGMDEPALVGHKG